MCVKGQRSQRQSKNGKGEGLEGSKLASAKECEGHTEVFGFGKLLQTVCQGFCKGSKTPL